MEESMKAVKTAKPISGLMTEYNAFIQAADGLKALSGKTNKKLFIKTVKDPDLLECNRNFGPLYQKALDTLKVTDAFVAKQQATVKGLKANSKDFIAQTKLLKAAVTYQNNLSNFCEAYKTLTEQPAKFDEMMALKEKRQKIFNSGVHELDFEATRKMEEEEKKRAEKPPAVFLCPFAV